ncbi:MAG: hypothetical protein IJN04_01190 [Clostridia bacterium]|nr:hypothetical protein [Clostridia bacterium]
MVLADVNNAGLQFNRQGDTGACVGQDQHGVTLTQRIAVIQIQGDTIGGQLLVAYRRDRAIAEDDADSHSGKVKKTIESTAHAAILAIAVFVNIGVWLIEQLVAIDFEMLSVSYIISELFLLGIHLVMNEYQRMKRIVKQVETVQGYSTDAVSAPDVMLETPVKTEPVAPEHIETFMAGLKALTPTERAIYDAYVARVTTKEIMASMNIKESTVKYHSRNLYAKLGVANRKELLELHKHIKSVKAMMDNPLPAND